MEPRDPLTYRAAGVDIETADVAVERIKQLAQSTYSPNVKAGVGGFGAVYELQPDTQGNLLVAGTDGVGTKLKIAFALDKHDTVGIDLVAMSANDVLTLGAQPLFMLDYIACGKLKPEVTTAIVAGISEGCRQAGCALIGGEIAEMPGFYPEGEYDLAGFVVGSVKQDEVINGSAITPGDVIIGLRSSGLHSNGYSLARAIIEREGLPLEASFEGLSCPLGEELLRPTRLFVAPIRALMAALPVKGMAHITGGGLPGNLVRILPKGCVARIEKANVPVLPIFDLLQHYGATPLEEMYKTFNMGIGFTVVVAASDASLAMETLASSGEAPVILGVITPGDEPHVELV